MADKVYKSPLDMSAEEWDKQLGEATAHTDLNQPDAIKGRVNFTNKDAFLKKHGLDKFYEFDGGDLWNINEEGEGEDKNGMTTIRVGYGEPSWDEEKLLTAIESLGRWKRPDPAVQKLKDAGWSNERIAAAEKGIKEKHPEKLIGSKSRFAQKYPDRYEKVKKRNVYGEGRTAEDVDWDFIAQALGVDID